MENTEDQGFSVEAIRLEDGGTYVIECDIYLTVAQREQLEKSLFPLGSEKGITFLVLDRGMRIGRQIAIHQADYSPAEEPTRPRSHFQKIAVK